MKQGLLLIETTRKRKPTRVAPPALLIVLEPWHKIFFRNFADLFRPEEKALLQVVSRPADFWPDVFVATPLPWRRFAQSSFAHIVVIATVCGWAQFWPHRAPIVRRPVFNHSDVVYYEASDYLPPLDTGGTSTHLQRKGEPEHAAQPIISVPPEADNRTQTVVAPPKLKLNSDVPLPNVVAWARPQPTIPLAVTANAVSDAKLPALPTLVVAPPVDTPQTEMNRAPSLAEAAIAPAPQVENAASRLSDINIGRVQVVAPAPQLPVDEQRALGSVASIGSSTAVVPPAPVFQERGDAKDGRLVALNLHPVAPGGPVDVPTGNRRGTFAATPDGKPGATGSPDIPGDNRRSASGAGSENNANGAPPGLMVGASPKGESKAAIAGSPGAGASKTFPSDNSRLLASATPPRVSSIPRRSDLPSNAMSELERRVFGGRKSYSMTLNVPNLNSAGGSWVMHFAELKEGDAPGELVAPVATQAVDPGYPIELMRQNVQGTVTLSALIRSDGSVSEVHVLQGVDDRLDQYASAAMSRWKFRPATKNGEAVALQAVVMIPFRLRKAGF